MGRLCSMVGSGLARFLCDVGGGRDGYADWESGVSVSTLEQIVEGKKMANPIKATPVVRGKDATRILEEMRNGTPDTPKRIETIRRADSVYRRAAPRHNFVLEDEVEAG